jgi:hypothetical protein
VQERATLGRRAKQQPQRPTAIIFTKAETPLGFVYLIWPQVARLATLGFGRNLWDWQTFESYLRPNFACDRPVCWSCSPQRKLDRP